MAWRVRRRDCSRVNIYASDELRIEVENEDSIGKKELVISDKTNVCLSEVDIRILSRDVYEKPGLCELCGGSEYWISPALTGWICSRCSPPRSCKMESGRYYVNHD